MVDESFEEFCTQHLYGKEKLYMYVLRIINNKNIKILEKYKFIVRYLTNIRY